MHGAGLAEEVPTALERYVLFVIVRRNSMQSAHFYDIRQVIRLSSVDTLTYSSKIASIRYTSLTFSLFGVALQVALDVTLTSRELSVENIGSELSKTQSSVKSSRREQIWLWAMLYSGFDYPV